MRRWLFEPGPSGFVGSIVGTLTLPTQAANLRVYCPVNGFAYFTAAQSVYVVDPSGTPSLVTTITTAHTAVGMAYLPVSNKILYIGAGGGANKYQIIDCSNNTISAETAFITAMASPPNVISSYCVNPANDVVYMGGTNELCSVAPGTGICVPSGSLGTWATNMGFCNGLCFNPADGYVYAVGSNGAHAVQVIDPTLWTTSSGLVHDFGSGITNQVAGPGPGINRLTGHVYLDTQANATKIFVATSPTTFVTITPTTTGPWSTEYDSDLGQMFSAEGGTPGGLSVYNSSDASILRTNLGGALINNPQVILPCTSCDRYIAQTPGSAVIQIIAR